MRFNPIKRLVRLRARIAESRSLGKPAFVSVANQIVTSGTNFALAIYLVQQLSPYEYGLYGIGFAICLFLAGIGSALLLTQMVVHTPDKDESKRSQYSVNILLAVLAYCACFAAPVLLVLIAGAHKFPSLVEYQQYGVAVVFASVAYLVKEFFVRHAYTQGAESRALLVHGVLAMALAGALLGVRVADVKLTVDVALGIYAITNLVAAIYGYISSGLRHTPLTLVQFRADVSQAWQGGKWASIASLLFFARSQAHTVVVAVLIGPIGVAKLNAARLFVTPAAMFIPALAQVALPRMAQAYRDSYDKARQLGALLTNVLLAITISYSALLLVVVEPLVESIVGPGYGSLFWLVLAWALYACALALRNGREVLIQVHRAFKLQARSSALAASLTLCSVVVLVLAFGELGAILGLVVGELYVVFLYKKAEPTKGLSTTSF